jgi:hypothetical protein
MPPEHGFTARLKETLADEFGPEIGETLLAASSLLQYVHIKTKSADRGSKARGSFANLYAIYVLVEDYVKAGFPGKGNYRDYEGARFSDLFTRQRQLPFGAKLQNHALNDRLNGEFRKFFPLVDSPPIIRNVQTQSYWINESLLIVRAGKKPVNIARAVLKIIDRYVEAKQSSFDAFIEYCERLKTVEANDGKAAIKFIEGLLAPNVDARIFEIVSYSVLKSYYYDQTVFWGLEMESIQAEPLKLYKTGRTNANDGGIDFVMKPLGRFFQVTETTDVRKYFLDIDKLERFPITFVVKSTDSVEELRQAIRCKAEEQFPVSAVVERYLACIEEIINVPVLVRRFKDVVRGGSLGAILEEIVRQSKVEFNYDGGDEEPPSKSVARPPVSPGVDKSNRSRAARRRKTSNS